MQRFWKIGIYLVICIAMFCYLSFVVTGSVPKTCCSNIGEYSRREPSSRCVVLTSLSMSTQGYYVGHRLSNSKNSFSFQTFEFANEASRKHQVSITKLEYAMRSCVFGIVWHWVLRDSTFYREILLLL